MVEALLGNGDDMATIATTEGWRRRIWEVYRVRVKTASLSSLLAKMTKEGRLLRIDGFGPQGGYGYCRAPELSDRVKGRLSERRDQRTIERGRELVYRRGMEILQEMDSCGSRHPISSADGVLEEANRRAAKVVQEGVFALEKEYCGCGHAWFLHGSSGCRYPAGYDPISRSHDFCACLLQPPSDGWHDGTD